MGLVLPVDLCRNLGRMDCRLGLHLRVQCGTETEFARGTPGCRWEPAVLARKDSTVEDSQRRSLTLFGGLVTESEGLEIGMILTLQTRFEFEAAKMIGWFASLCLMPIQLVGETLVV